MPRAPKHCTNYETCGNKALAGKRNCGECGNSRWPVDQPDRYKRMREIPTETYLRIYKRDDYACKIRYVGCTGEADQLDHIVPSFEGGGDDDSNLQSACDPCHRAKSSDEGHRAQGHKTVARERLS